MWVETVGAGVLEAAGVDGGAVCGESDRAGEIDATVSDGGPGAVAGEWRAGVSGAGGWRSEVAGDAH